MDPSFITIQGLKLALYEKQGKGPALFFVHGNSSNAHAFESVWKNKHLNDYHLMAIDLPGHGKSAMSKDGRVYTINSLGKIISEVIEQRKLQNVILVSHSMAGHIALGVLNSTERVVGISLAGSVPLNGAHELLQAYIISEATQTVFKADATEAEIVEFSKAAVHKEDKREVIIKSFKETDKRFREEMGLELGRHFGSENFISEIDLLRKNNLCVCFIHGMEERTVSLTHLRSIQGLNLFQNKVHVIKDVGHCVPFESPEEYAKILADFATHLSGIRG